MQVQDYLDKLRIKKKKNLKKEINYLVSQVMNKNHLKKDYLITNKLIIKTKYNKKKKIT